MIPISNWANEYYHKNFAEKRQVKKHTLIHDTEKNKYDCVECKYSVEVPREWLMSANEDPNDPYYWDTFEDLTVAVPDRDENYNDPTFTIYFKKHGKYQVLKSHNPQISEIQVSGRPGKLYKEFIEFDHSLNSLMVVVPHNDGELYISSQFIIPSKLEDHWIQSLESLLDNITLY